MKIKKIKNVFGLCAIEGCHNLANTKFEITNQENNHKRTIYTCLDCSFKICEFNLKNL